jgi:hypothetical protein
MIVLIDKRHNGGDGGILVTMDRICDSARPVVTPEGLWLEVGLKKKDDVPLRILLPEEVVQHLIEAGQHVYFCSESGGIGKITCTIKISRDDLLMKKGAYLLMKELR